MNDSDTKLRVGRCITLRIGVTFVSLGSSLIISWHRADSIQETQGFVAMGGGVGNYWYMNFY